MDNLKYWLWLITLRGIGARSQQRLLEKTGSPKTLWRMTAAELPQLPELKEKDVRALSQKDLTKAEQVLSDCEKEGISILTMADPRYPRRLREIETAPAVLFYRGTMLPFDDLPAVAVIGSRSASDNGLKTARRMGWELAACGGTVISGAAKGVDSCALEGALLTGRPAAAVLGNGLDIVYPSEAKTLYHAIAENGCLLSEFVPGTKPFASNFPRRNRILSGLSRGVLVVEAAKKSGSLITVNYALEQGRDVFAMPGSVGIESCEGSNYLLQDGAGFALCGWDVMQEYQLDYPELVRHSTAAMPKQRTAAGPEPAAAGAGNAKSTGKRSRKPAGEPRKNAAAPAAKTGDSAGKQKNLIDIPSNTNYIDLQQIQSKLLPDQAQIVGVIGADTLHVDDIITKTGLAPARVLSALTLLEIQGIVQQRPGKLFSLKL